MTTVARRPFLLVLIDGVALPVRFGARVTHSYKAATSEAQIMCPNTLTTNVGLWSRVAIVMGANAATATTRFVGYVTGFDSTLWPGAVSIICKGPLIKAKQLKSSNRRGTSLIGYTDQAAITFLLAESGLSGSEVAIDGNGIVMGTTVTDPTDQRFTFTQKRPALSMIHEYDKVGLGFRTADTPGGTVVRQLTSSIPQSGAAYTFTEGIDIVSGSANVEVQELKNKVTAKGFNGIFFEASAVNTSVGAGGGTLTHSLQSWFLESSLTSEALGVSAEMVANFGLTKKNRNIGKVTFVTPRDELMAPGQTIAIVAPSRLLFNQKIYIQSITTEVSMEGIFSQSLTTITDLGDGNRLPAPSGIPLTPVRPDPQTVTLLTADFALIGIDQEKVLVADTPVDIFVVYAEDTSISISSTIVTRSWVASGPGVTVTTGSGVGFTTSFTSLTGSSIVLTVTDADANTKSITKLPGDSAASTRLQKLYTAAGNYMEAFDGGTWAKDAPSAGTVIVVANGPLAAAGITTFTVPTYAGGGSISMFAGGSSDGLWRRNAGVWEMAPGYGSGGIYALAVVSGNPLILATYDDLASEAFSYSTDGGTTRSEPPVVGPIASGRWREPFVSVDANTWYMKYRTAAGHDGVWKTTDQFASWTWILDDTLGAQDYGRFGVWANATYIYEAYAKDDDGSAPHSATTQIRRCNVDGTGIVDINGFSPPGANVLVAGVTGDPAVPGTIVIWNQASIQLGKVVGTTFTDITDGGMAGTGLIGGAAVYGNIVLVYIARGSAGEIWRSTNLGTSWTMVKNDSDLSNGQGYERVNQIAISPSDGLTAICVGSTGFVWVSSDAGATWTKETLVGGGSEELICVAVP